MYHNLHLLDHVCSYSVQYLGSSTQSKWNERVVCSSLFVPQSHLAIDKTAGDKQDFVCVHLHYAVCEAAWFYVYALYMLLHRVEMGSHSTAHEYWLL